jgi:hypothetical protein
MYPISTIQEAPGDHLSGGFLVSTADVEINERASARALTGNYA